MGGVSAFVIKALLLNHFQLISLIPNHVPDCRELCVKVLRQDIALPFSSLAPDDITL